MSETPPPPGEPTPIPPQDPVTPPGGTLPPTPDLGGDIPDPADVEKNKVFALLSYIGILFIIPLVAAKDSKFAKFHANQGMLLFGIFFALTIVMVIIRVAVHFVPVLGCIAGCGMCVLSLVVSLSWLAFAIIGILNAVNGKMKPLPLFPKITIVK